MERGYVVIIFNTSEKESSLKPILNSLSNRQLDGIIMVPVANLKQEYIDAFNLQAPVVIVDRYFPEMKTGRVTIDNYKAGLDATKHLLDKGCRNIALLMYRDSLMHMQERKRGYIDALREYGCYNPNNICEVEYHDHEETINNFFHSALNSPEPIDGLFVTTGGLSGRVLKILLKLKVKIPEDLQVIGFDKEIAIDSEESIPYVKQPMERISQCAVDILLSQIKNKTIGLVDCRLQASIVSE